MSAAPTPLTVPSGVRAVEGSPTVAREPETPALAAARADLAARLDIPVDQVEVSAMEQVEWPDASLGCPEPGMMYAQVVTLGYRIVLKAEGKQYEYHADRAGHVVYCPARELPQPAIQVPEAARQVVERAKAELAAELGVAEEAIGVVSVEPVEWRDSSLGCPEPGMMYLQVITPGYRIVLQKGDQVFIYHSDRGRRVIRCEKQQPPVPSPATLLQPDEEPGVAAREDLAARLGVAQESVELVGEARTEISAAELEACTETTLPSRFTRPAERIGRELTLRVGNAEYRYLVVGRLLVPCFH